GPERVERLGQVDHRAGLADVPAAGHHRGRRARIQIQVALAQQVAPADRGAAVGRDLGRVAHLEPHLGPTVDHLDPDHLADHDPGHLDVVVLQQPGHVVESGRKLVGAAAEDVGGPDVADGEAQVDGEHHAADHEGGELDDRAGHGSNPPKTCCTALEPLSGGTGTVTG